MLEVGTGRAGNPAQGESGAREELAAVAVEAKDTARASIDGELQVLRRSPDTYRAHQRALGIQSRAGLQLKVRELHPAQAQAQPLGDGDGDHRGHVGQQDPSAVVRCRGLLGRERPK